ncbi:hypothetical protein Ocin01_04653 [Orchesella cincta]|uniref:Uncharacterized protein n=1 Tax=Orchesella cincta TaxID=48709 RepID=A0A1D2N9V0_ORCCI|nr:hypothetical protein Ocin01_04653 [Orchesella cincta]
MQYHHHHHQIACRPKFVCICETRPTHPNRDLWGTPAAIIVCKQQQENKTTTQKCRNEDMELTLVLIILKKFSMEGISMTDSLDWDGDAKMARGSGSAPKYLFFKHKFHPECGVIELEVLVLVYSCGDRYAQLLLFWLVVRKQQFQSWSCLTHHDHCVRDCPRKDKDYDNGPFPQWDASCSSDSPELWLVAEVSKLFDESPSPSYTGMCSTLKSDPL